VNRPTAFRAGNLVLAIAVLLAACSGGASPSDCVEGISPDIGGCDPNRPTFAAQTCAELGREVGRALDERLVGIIEGAAVVDEESQAVRATQLMALTADLANRHARASGIVADCSADELLAAAEPEFSSVLRERAGDYLYDGTSVTYQDWRAELLRFLSLVDTN
jgi:hypothetical protein